MPAHLHARLAASLAFAFAVTSLAACAAEDATTIDCETATVVGYAELQAFTYCTSCHGANRADENIRFDTYDEAVANAEAAQDAVADGSMPDDGGSMPDEAKQELYTWVQCGQPE